MLCARVSRSCRFISAAASVAFVFSAILSQTEGNPLVYPNRFSFQKTTTTSSTTDIPMHDHSNNSISSFGNAIATESGLPSSHSRFRYDIAAWVIGALLLAGLLFLIFYPRRRRRNELSSASSSCYVFPADSNLSIKADLDSHSIIENTNNQPA